DATGLPTGRYDYQVAVAPVSGGPGDPNAAGYSGQVDLVNEHASPFGAGWSLSGLYRLWPVGGGVVLEMPGGDSAFLPDSNAGPGGPVPLLGGGGGSMTVQQNPDGSYTLTQHDGTQVLFSPAGLQTTVTDRNGRSTAYAYDGS